MSTFGFRAYNDANQVLISSSLENYHYGGKAEYVGIKSAYSAYGGHRIHTYRFTTDGVPLMFIKPTDYTQFYAILTHRNTGTAWEFDVIHSGTVNVKPDIHAFVTPKNLPVSDEQFGMQVFLPDGTVSFDSRLSPLAIVGGGVCQPTACAPNDGCTPNMEISTEWGYKTLDWDFNSDESFNSYNLQGLDNANLMFASPSLSLSAWIRKYYGHKYSEGGCGESGQAHESWVEWGVLYRNAFRLTADTFDAGWIPIQDSYYFSSQHDSGGMFGGGGGSTTTGVPLPFTQKTINLVDNAYFLVDATKYV